MAAKISGPYLDSVADLLLIDDNHYLAEVFADTLRDEGHKVRVAHDGEQGLAQLHAELPELVLCDVEMPVLDGPGFAYRALLHDAGAEKIPIIFVSGVADLRLVAERVGTPYFLSKPVGLKELLSMLERALRERIAPKPRFTAANTP